MISEAIPILLYMYWLIKNKILKNITTSQANYYLRLGVLLILTFLICGLRGSRSNFLFAFLWILTLSHMYEKRLSNNVLVAGIVIVFLFSIPYGFYKQAGTEALGVFTGDITVKQITEQYENRSVGNSLIGDFSRTSIHPYMLYRMYNYPEQYSYGFGITYLGDTLGIILPKNMTGMIPNKRSKGTDLIYGEGAFKYYGPERSSRIYGTKGEALLNFGLSGVPIIYFIWGALVAIVTSLYNDMNREKEKLIALLMTPLLIRVTGLAYMYDWGNILFQLIKNGAIPLLFLLLISKKLKSRKVVT